MGARRDARRHHRRHRVRGVLEGLAAMRIGERGMSAGQPNASCACLVDGDAILRKGHLVEADLAAYQDMNIRFHSAIVEGGGSRAIRGKLWRATNIYPCIRARARRRSHASRPRIPPPVLRAHTAPHDLRGARQPADARAEALMREHAKMRPWASISPMGAWGGEEQRRGYRSDRTRWAAAEDFLPNSARGPRLCLSSSSDLKFDRNVGDMAKRKLTAILAADVVVLQQGLSALTKTALCPGLECSESSCGIPLSN